MGGEDNVDALHAAGHLAIDVEAVMRHQHDEFRPFRARLVDLFLHLVFADAERPFREHPAGIGDCGVGIGLADDGDLHAAALEHLPRLEDLFLEFVVAHVLGEEREGERFDDFLDPFGAQRELPMPGHRVRLEQVHALDDVLRLRLQRGPGIRPGVTAIEQQAAVLSPLGADGLDGHRHPVVTTHAAVILRELAEILAGQRIGHR